MILTRHIFLWMIVPIVLGVGLITFAHPAASRNCATIVGRKKGLLQADVRYRSDSDVFEYRYTLTNPTDSPMRLERLVLGYTPPVTQITGPDAWVSGLKETSDDETFGLSPATVTWRSHEGRRSESGGKPSNFRSRVDRDVAPGETLGGFGFQSPNPPGFTSYGVLGRIQVTDTVSRTRSRRLVRRCSDITTLSLFSIAVQGDVFGPRHGLRVSIAVRPGSHLNTVHPTSQGVVPVALLGSDTFSVSKASDTQALFGVTMTEPVRPGEIEDVNNDGHEDLVFYFPISETSMTKEKNKAALAVALDEPIRRQAPLFGSETFRVGWGTDRLSVVGEPKVEQDVAGGRDS